MITYTVGITLAEARDLGGDLWLGPGGNIRYYLGVHDLIDADPRQDVPTVWVDEFGLNIDGTTSTATFTDIVDAVKRRLRHL